MVAKFKFLIRELMLYICYFVIPENHNRRRVIIFGQGRTGSTLLENLICSTGYFDENGEIFCNNILDVTSPIKFLLGISKKNRNNHFIFHLKIYHLTRDRKKNISPYSFLKELEKRGWFIIHLSRRNKLKHALSNVLVKHRGNKYHKYDNSVEKYQINLNLAHLEEEVELRIAYDQQEQIALKGIKHIRVVYEDELMETKNHQVTIDKILDYVQLNPKPVKTKMKRINSFFIEDIILNFSELTTLLKKKGWLDYLK